LVVPAAGQSGSTNVSVPGGGDLQAAINRAKPGDTILLEPGATYLGNFVLPAKSGGDAFITIRSSAADSLLPGPDARIDPTYSAHLPRLRSPNAQPVLATAPGAHHYRLLFLEFQANRNGVGDIITLGDGSGAQNTLAQVPHDLVIDRAYVHGDPQFGQKRGIALNSASTSIINSYVAGIRAEGQDSQAVGGWNGPGPFRIVNNYLEAAGENLMFGGSDPAIPNLVPADIVISGNHLSKPVAWRSEPKWTVKNLLELKNARRVTIARNLFENNWLAAQTGFAILLTPRNQDGRCPWCQVEEVVFEQNTLRNSAAGIAITGRDNNHPSRQTRAITIRNNVFHGLDSSKWGGNGFFLMLLDEPRDIVIDHNTIVQERASGLIVVSGPPILGFVFTNNVARHHEYGMKGDSRAAGLDTIRAYFPGSLITSNVIADGEARFYPEGNIFPSSAEFQRQFVSYEGGDYRIAPASAWRGAGSDGGDLGAGAAIAPPRVGRRPRPPGTD
jgi:hypothetical protein